MVRLIPKKSDFFGQSAKTTVIAAVVGALIIVIGAGIVGLPFAQIMGGLAAIGIGGGAVEVKTAGAIVVFDGVLGLFGLNLV